MHKIACIISASTNVSYLVFSVHVLSAAKIGKTRGTYFIFCGTYPTLNGKYTVLLRRKANITEIIFAVYRYGVNPGIVNEVAVCHVLT